MLRLVWSSWASFVAARCTVKDPLDKLDSWLPQRSKRVDVFVAGVEGSGHHGVVNGLLLPLIKHSLSRGGNATSLARVCVQTGEMPFYEREKKGEARNCDFFGKIGWESFPSRRRLFENERLPAIYKSADCLAGAGSNKFPTRWNRLREPDSCYRCGTWRATLEDVYLRHTVSDRLDVSAFHGGFPTLKVLFLWRNFVHSVFSHPPWDGGIRGHAMMLAAHLAALADDAREMPRDAWRVLRYEDLMDHESYVRVAEAAVAFLGYAPLQPLRRAAEDARSSSWRSPSREHAAAAEDATEDHRRAVEVDLAFRHKWAVFHDPDVQLVPETNNDRRGLRKAGKNKGRPQKPPANAPPRPVLAPQPPGPWSLDDCMPPKWEPCKRCTPVPVTTNETDGRGRWCLQIATENPRMRNCCN